MSFRWYVPLCSWRLLYRSGDDALTTECYVFCICHPFDAQIDLISFNDYIQTLKNGKKPRYRKIPRLSFWLRREDLNLRPAAVPEIPCSRCSRNFDRGHSLLLAASAPGGARKRPLRVMSNKPVGHPAEPIEEVLGLIDVI